MWQSQLLIHTQANRSHGHCVGVQTLSVNPGTGLQTGYHWSYKLTNRSLGHCVGVQTLSVNPGTGLQTGYY